FNEAIREAELDTVQRDIEAIGNIDPVADVRAAAAKTGEDIRRDLEKVGEVPKAERELHPWETATPKIEPPAAPVPAAAPVPDAARPPLLPVVAAERVVGLGRRLDRSPVQSQRLPFARNDLDPGVRHRVPAAGGADATGARGIHHQRYPQERPALRDRAGLHR